FALPASVSSFPSRPQLVLCSSVLFQSCVFFHQFLKPVLGEVDGQLDVVAFTLPLHYFASSVLRMVHRRSRFSRGLRSRRWSHRRRWSRFPRRVSRPTRLEPALREKLRDVLQGIIRLSRVSILFHGFA